MFRYVQYIPGFGIKHLGFMEQLLDSIDRLCFLDQDYIDPASDISFTPLSSPGGHVVSYKRGIFLCLLETLLLIQTYQSEMVAMEANMIS